MNIAFKVISYLSIILALVLTYNLLIELSEIETIFEIELIPILIFLIVVSNGVLGFYFLYRKVKPRKYLLILQTLIIIPTCLLLYQIFFNSTISCY